MPEAFIKCFIVVTTDCIKGIRHMRFHAYFRRIMEFNPLYKNVAKNTIFVICRSNYDLELWHTLFELIHDINVT